MTNPVPVYNPLPNPTLTDSIWRSQYSSQDMPLRTIHTLWICHVLLRHQQYISLFPLHTLHQGKIERTQQVSIARATVHKREIPLHIFPYGFGTDIKYSIALLCDFYDAAWHLHLKGSRRFMIPIKERSPKIR